MTLQVFKLLFSARGKFYKSETFIDQKCNLVRSSECPVDSFTGISFTVVDCGENAIRGANPRLTCEDLTLDSYHDYHELPRLFKRADFGTTVFTVQAVMLCLSVNILSTVFTAFSISYKFCVLF